ncbi:hypothetical protein ER308_11115 [Egibacter rhizosphaerae]|uniref:Lipoprotein n=1 Tax=Egibacter rhizosphaerae TaxID=1670831 RepID=A0A411YFT7_9ACTN|nr:hypothetical protein [Egibacter rhizosphaerae]QBI20056.1 hypothetical protein ER308_11115 [Egibacter rhizosphaerae]
MVLGPLRRLLIVLGALLLVAGCADDVDEPAADTDGDPADEEPDGDPDDDEPDEPADDEPDVDEPDDEPAEEDDAAEADVGLRIEDGDLGEFLVDGEGMTLYLFTQDEGGESVCYDECAENWPPLLVDDDVEAGEGVDEDLVSTTTRDDGEEQVTYGDWPLYYWIADEEPGDTDGQGVEDVWYLVSPDGEEITGSADDADEDDGDGEGEMDTGY